MQVVNIVFLSALFAKVPMLNGWTFWSVVMMFGAVALAEGVGSLFFEGMWRPGLADQPRRAGLLPGPPVPGGAAGRAAPQVGINGLSNIVTGGLMIGTGLAHVDIAWTPWPGAARRRCC